MLAPFESVRLKYFISFQSLFSKFYQVLWPKSSGNLKKKKTPCFCDVWLWYFSSCGLEKTSTAVDICKTIHQGRKHFRLLWASLCDILTTWKLLCFFWKRPFRISLWKCQCSWFDSLLFKWRYARYLLVFLCICWNKVSMKYHSVL